MTGQHELEATLIILPDNPQAVAQQIAVLTSVVNYRLLPRERQPIRDLYLDTPDKALQAKKIALRIRELRGKHWITLKGALSADTETMREEVVHLTHVVGRTPPAPNSGKRRRLFERILP